MVIDTMETPSMSKTTNRSSGVGVLRKMFSHINPYHFSCLYKKTFEDNAVKVLQQCEDNTHTNKEDEEDFLLSPWQPSNDTDEEEESECLEERKKRRKKRKRQDESQPPFSIEGFYSGLDLGPDSRSKHTASLAHSVSPWQVCHSAHLPHLDSYLLPEDYSCADHAPAKPSEEACSSLLTSNRRGSNLSTDRNISLTSDVSSPISRSSCTQVEPWQGTSNRPTSMPSSHNSAEKHIGRKLTSLFSDRSRSEPDRILQLATKLYKDIAHSEGGQLSERGGRQYSKDGRMYNRLGSGKREKRPQTIPYKFRYHKDYRKYMEDYKKVYTNLLLNEDASNEIPDRTSSVSDSRESPTVPTANVECDDVREGACIRPSSSTSVKVSHYKFPFPSRCRVGSPKRSTPSPSSRSRSSTYSSITPSNTPSPQCLSQLSATENMAIADKLQVVGYTTVKEKLLASRPRSSKECSSPIITRTRPTIPSNAKGIVCDTAVETPLHIVSHLRGKQVIPNQRDNRSAIKDSSENLTERTSDLNLGSTTALGFFPNRWTFKKF